VTLPDESKIAAYQVNYYPASSYANGLTLGQNLI
jgi:hypothetical protein